MRDRRLRQRPNMYSVNGGDWPPQPVAMLPECGLRIGIPMLKSFTAKLFMPFGLIIPLIVLPDVCRPGGAASPGGGPLAVENG